MYGAHRSAGAVLSVAVREMPDVGRYGSLEVICGRIVGFREKGGSGAGLINAGTYLVSAEVMARIPCGRAHSFEQDC